MKILDMFCCQGGASMGYHTAGFDVVGVDVAPKRKYPFEFVQGDALEYLQKHYHEFDAIHASPPCQHFTKYRNCRKDIHTRYENLIPQTRAALVVTGLPYIIENVVGAPLINPLVLCGSMFGLDIRRHRLFESNVMLPHLKCDHTIWAPNRFPGGRSRERGNARTPCRATVEIGRWNIPIAVQKQAMGIDWIDDLRSLSEALPPAYTEYIGKYLLEYINNLRTRKE